MLTLLFCSLLAGGGGGGGTCGSQLDWRRRAQREAFGSYTRECLRSRIPSRETCCSRSDNTRAGMEVKVDTENCCKSCIRFLCKTSISQRNCRKGVQLKKKNNLLHLEPSESKVYFFLMFSKVKSNCWAVKAEPKIQNHSLPQETTIFTEGRVDVEIGHIIYAPAVL